MHLPSAPMRRRAAQAAVAGVLGLAVAAVPGGARPAADHPSRGPAKAVWVSGLSPTVDRDRDGLSDRAERVLGTDPRRADTDHDGVRDGREVMLGRNPRNGHRRHRLRRTLMPRLILWRHPAPTPTHTTTTTTTPTTTTPTTTTPTTTTTDPAPAPAPGPLFVDGASLAGACSDAQTADQVAASGRGWCTLRRAIEAAIPLSAGAYNSASYPWLDVESVQRPGYVTLQPYGTESVSVNGVQFGDSTYVRLKGMRITNYVTINFGTRHLQLVGNDISPGGILVQANTSDLLLEGNRIHDITVGDWPAGTALRIMGYWSSDPSKSGVRDVTVRDNRFENMSEDGIQAASFSNLVVDGNTFTRVRAAPWRQGIDHADAIQSMGGDGLVVTDNVFYDNDAGVLVKDGITTGLQLVNNTFSKNDGYATQVFDAPNAWIVNNTWWNAGYGLILRDDPSVPAFTTATVMNNIIDHFNVESVAMLTYENYNLIGDGYRAGRNDVAGSPVFADPSSPELGLAAGSPGIDAANSTGAPSTDRVGSARRDDPSVANSGGGVATYYDMGARER